MSKPCLLLVDCLGTKDIWQKSGRLGAVESFESLRKWAIAALPKPATPVLSGLVETDAVALVFASAEEALAYARRLFLNVFTAGDPSEARFWLRGALVSCPAQMVLRESTALHPSVPQVTWNSLDGDLLDAIAIEKAGFRGMRLVVDERLITPAVCADRRISIGKRFLVPLKRLSKSVYPGRLSGGFKDYLWMCCSGEPEWDAITRLMATRLRWSAANPDEFVQAAATQVVFHECSAIIGSLRLPRRQRA